MSFHDVLEIWTVYDHPIEYPDWFVARKWLATPEGEKRTDEIMKAATLDELRALLPLGLGCIDRAPWDDPSIVESWL
jgi:hypothetical protein